ncbi:MAG: hypothetical protein E6R03_06145 [Hyphomicrobiaceae bacterium]|nr:MAG: hypothetical protein E6R03_06145 [Hyphomicrobiaceae bacterium]
MSLTRRQITVRTKRGKSYKRSMLVRAGEQVRRFVSKHKGKLAVGAGVAALGLGAYALHSQRKSVAEHKANAAAAHAAYSKWTEETMKRRAAAEAAVNEHFDKAHQAANRVRERIDNLERKINVAKHGRTVIRSSEESHAWQKERDYQRDTTRMRQRHDSDRLNHYADSDRYASAERSGHYSKGFGGGSPTARHRLESGLPQPPAPPTTAKPKRTRARKAK